MSRGGLGGAGVAVSENGFLGLAFAHGHPDRQLQSLALPAIPALPENDCGTFCCSSIFGPPHHVESVNYAVAFTLSVRHLHKKATLMCSMGSSALALTEIQKTPGWLFMVYATF